MKTSLWLFVAVVYGILMYLMYLIMKFNWRKFALDLLKVITGALAGWLGAGAV